MIIYICDVCRYIRYPKNVMKIGSKPGPDFVPMDSKMELCIATKIDPFWYLSLFAKAETFHKCFCNCSVSAWLL